MSVSINNRVKITKGKRAKSWKVLGIVLPLPLIEGGEMQYILANRNKNIYVYPNQILEVLQAEI